jgi:hypothetical protein
MKKFIQVLLIGATVAATAFAVGSQPTKASAGCGDCASCASCCVGK